MHPQQQGKGMRACGIDEQAAAAHPTIAILSAQIAELPPPTHQTQHRNLVTPSYPAPTPPDPPPPRLS
jgi:hypothetical protein